MLGQTWPLDKLGHTDVCLITNATQIVFIRVVYLASQIMECVSCSHLV